MSSRVGVYPVFKTNIYAFPGHANSLMCGWVFRKHEKKIFRRNPPLKWVNQIRHHNGVTHLL